MFDLDEEEYSLPSMEFVEIEPLRDFHIVCNEDDIKIKDGEIISVPAKYIQNLKTEKVIK